MRSAALLALGFGALIILVVLAHDGGVKVWFTWYACWAFVPLLVFYHAIRFLSSWGPAHVVHVTTMFAVGLGSFFYVYAFFLRPDPQSPLVFLFVPFYQIGAALALYLIALISWMIHRRTNRLG